MTDKNHSHDIGKSLENEIDGSGSMEPEGGFGRRDFLMAGAAGAAGIAATGLGANMASAKMVVPGEVLKKNATKGGKRVAIINDALLQIGPPLARNFAKMGYNLVIAQPVKGLVKECEGHGAKVIVVPGTNTMLAPALW